MWFKINTEAGTSQLSQLHVSEIRTQGGCVYIKGEGGERVIMLDQLHFSRHYKEYILEVKDRVWLL